MLLWSSGLLSKWGFGDGDMPDHIWDHVGDETYMELDWRPVLRLLVRRHLLPVLDQDVVVYDIETNHNPIRAAKVDGREIDDMRDNEDITLTPDVVEVTWAQIEEAIQEASRG